MIRAKDLLIVGASMAYAAFLVTVYMTGQVIHQGLGRDRKYPYSKP